MYHFYGWDLEIVGNKYYVIGQNYTAINYEERNLYFKIIDFDFTDDLEIEFAGQNVYYYHPYMKIIDANKIVMVGHTRADICTPADSVNRVYVSSYILDDDKENLNLVDMQYFGSPTKDSSLYGMCLSTETSC